MERKYYLRGLGLGIVVTAIIMGIALSGSHKMTDEEIIKRAKELGMVEDTYLVDTDASEAQPEQNIEDNPEKQEEQKELSTAESKPESESLKPEEEHLPESVEAAESSKDASSGPEQTQPEKEVLPVAEPVEEESEPVQSKGPAVQKKTDTNEMTRQEDKPSSSGKLEKVTIVSGDGSYTVALKLKEAGVVMSAETFDDFLCERGYDKKLRTGTFQIPADASDEQIARIVTGQE